MEEIRLQKYFTLCGVMSRRSAEDEIEAGRVKVNGIVAELGQKVLPGVDEVIWNGRKIEYNEDTEFTYILLNKPRGYVTTAKDEKGRKCVTDLVRDVGVRLYPVGRLDMDSCGLLLLTNDGELANRLTHPRHEIPKIYEVSLNSKPSEEQLEILRSPLVIDGYRILPVKTELVTKDDSYALRMTLFEGRNRQIRKMCEIAGVKISLLMRVAIGKIRIGELDFGKWRYLTKDEVEYLKNTNKN